MTTKRTGEFRRFAFAATLSIVVGGAFVVPTVFARITLNTIDPSATIHDGGRRIALTGPIACDKSQTAVLRVTVTQRTTGAIAQGFATIACTVETQQWEVEASRRGKQAFAEGAATAVAVALTTDGEITDDAHQWLVAIALVAE